MVDFYRFELNFAKDLHQHLEYKGVIGIAARWRFGWLLRFFSDSHFDSF